MFALLRETDFMIDAGERVCLIGRNGAGKTSMLRLVTGEVEPDSGEINMPSVIGISQLEQALPRDLMSFLFLRFLLISINSVNMSMADNIVGVGSQSLPVRKEPVR